MSRAAAYFFPVAKAPLKERRAFRRYPLPRRLSFEAHCNGRRLELQRAPGLGNISAGGLYFCLGDGATPPVGTQLEIRLPLVQRLFRSVRVSFHCQAQVLRHDLSRRVAVRFHEVEFLREQRESALPLPKPIALSDRP
ncbi:MAG: PilZ domain-containing protein [Terriglobia bacterium]